MKVEHVLDFDELKRNGKYVLRIRFKEIDLDQKSQGLGLVFVFLTFSQFSHILIHERKKLNNFSKFQSLNDKIYCQVCLQQKHMLLGNLCKIDVFVNFINQ